MSDSDRRPALPPVDPSAAHAPSSTMTPELLAGLLADGDDELAAWALRNALDEASRAEVFDGLLNGAMTLVGERWASGRWSVADEHLASQTLLRALERIRPPTGPASRVGPLAVLAALPNERHAIGLACLEQVLGEAGWIVANLGADVPVPDLASFVVRNEARVVALSGSHADRLPILEEMVRAIRAARPDIPIMLGGRLAAEPGLRDRLGLAWVGTSLGEALRFAQSLDVADSAPPAVEEPF